jgi:hypothetical protein
MDRHKKGRIMKRRAVAAYEKKMAQNARKLVWKSREKESFNN